MIVLTLTEFAAKRRGDQDDMEKDLYPEVSEALQVYPATNWMAPLLAEVTRLYIDTYHREGGSGRPRNLDSFVRDVRDTLDKTENPTEATADRISTWLATAILNAATQEATAMDEEFLIMEWVTMHDKDVREAHREVEGQQRPPGEPYEVDGVAMRYPGDPRAPIELWINCRCTLAPLLASDAEFASRSSVTEPTGEAMDENQTPIVVPWHGVLAPEGEWSGDGRMFKEGALSSRDLPLPLTWQKVSDDGHKGSVTVAKIDRIERVGAEMRGTGSFLMSEEADEVVGMIAEFGRFGVSVDADDAEFEFNEDDGKITFTNARIASASIVAIPAFSNAWIALGDGGPDFMPSDTGDDEEDCDPTDPDSECYDPEAEAAPQPLYAGSSITFNGSWNNTNSYTWNTTFRDVSTEERKRDADAGRAMPDGSYPIDNCQDLKNAIQAIGRAKDPDKVKAHIRKRKSALGCPDVELPDTWDAETEEFRDPKSWWDERGKGWLTHPKETKRIHDYWTRPGEEGYAKIGWGAPGDFNRCRALVGEKIAENSPEDVRFLNRICAQWHHDALGIWPGEHHSLDTQPEGEPSPALSLVASGATRKAPAAWFENPNLTGPTHLTITEDGQVFGHIAEWTACHIGYDGVCVSPPHSSTDYAYFATGQVLLDNGSAARTGVISLGGGHAGHALRPRAAVEHYDSTSSAVCDVSVGEDEFGIWCAGWVRPGVTEEQVIALRASDVSGDWREFGTELELVAALACNVGGFPTVSVHDGRTVALVAAGVVQPAQPDESPVEELAKAILHQMDLRRVRSEKVAALTARMKERTAEPVQ